MVYNELCGKKIVYHIWWKNSACKLSYQNELSAMCYCYDEIEIETGLKFTQGKTRAYVKIQKVEGKLTGNISFSY